MKVSNEHYTIKLTPIPIPKKRADSAHLSLLGSKASKSRDIIERFRQEKSKAVNKRSAQKAKESGKKWSNVSLYSKITRSTMYTSNANKQSSFTSSETLSGGKALASMYSSINTHNFQSNNGMKALMGLNKNLFIKKSGSLNMKSTVMSLVDKKRLSDDRVSFNNPKLSKLAFEPLITLKSIERPIKHIYGFYRVNSNESNNVTFDEINTPLMKEKNLESLVLKPYVDTPTCEFKEITNKVGSGGLGAFVKNEIKPKYGNKFLERKLVKDKLENAVRYKRELNKQRLLKIKAYGSEIRERLNRKSVK